MYTFGYVSSADAKQESEQQINKNPEVEAFNRKYPRQKRENVDYKLVNERLDEPVRSYILPKDSWGLLDGPSVLKP